MLRASSSVAAVLALTLLSSAGEAAAGNGGWLRGAVAPTDANQARVEQARAERQGNDETFARGWGRGRHVLRAAQGEANNQATTEQTGVGNVAGIAQFGQNLNATITQDGTGNTATIKQWGRGSAATITQTGDNNAACVIQLGRHVSTDVVQTGGQSTALIQTRRGTREIPLELCTSAASRGAARSLWRRS